MRNLVLAAAASAVVLAAAPASAATIVKYTNRAAFQTASGAPIRETFNSYTSDVDFSNGSIDFGTFRLTHTRTFGGDTAALDTPPVAGGGAGNDGTANIQATVASSGTRYAELIIDFAAPTTSFGANFSSGGSGQVFFEVLGQNFNQTATGDGFIGFTSDTAFTRVIIKPRQGAAFRVTMDNVSFNAPGVPEPASWAMMIAGFGLAGGALRSRPRVKAVTA